MANTISRSLHDTGLAAWFGGTLAQAVSLNAAAESAGGDKAAGKVTNVGWDRWTPVNAAAIGAHLVGSVGQLGGNSGRIAGQKGVAGMSLLKTLVTGAALGVTYYSRVLGKKISNEENPAVRSGTKASKGTPTEIASAQGQLRTLQWIIPALTGTLVVISSFAGEQQRADEQASGYAARLVG